MPLGEHAAVDYNTTLLGPATRTETTEPILPKSTWRHDRGLQIHTQHIYKTEQEPLQRESNTTTRGHSQSSRKNAVKRGLEPISSVTALSTNGTICGRHVVTAPSLNSFKSRLDHQWCAYTYANNNDFPPMRTNIKPVQNG